MKFEQNFSMLFEDLKLPELFITEYFCNANGDYVKIYLYCLFLCKHGGEISALDLSKKLSIPIKSVEEGLKYWEDQKVLIKKNRVYELADLKMIAVNSLYTPKLTSSPEDALANNERNVLRSQAINEINRSFFQGIMSPNWYSLIDNFFQKYSFDEDVMIALFRYCFDKQALHVNYIQAVAEGWSSHKIHNINDLEQYYLDQEQTNKIKKSISKKLGITRNLSEYEEAYIEKWTKDYNYPMDVIEIALKKTTSTTNFNFKYLDSIISDWHDKNLNSASEVTNYIKEQKQKAKEIKNLKTSIEQGQTTLPKYFSESDQYSDLGKYYSDL